MAKTIAGALVGSALGAWGKKPKIPELPILDTAKVQREATEGNLAALPRLQELTSRVNQFTFDEVSKMLEQAIPGFRGMLTRAGSNAASLVRGEVPDDVSRALQTSTAARSLAGGFGGSGFSRNLFARDLGLTSLGLTQTGLGQTLQLGAFARQAFPQFDFTNAFISPQQKLAFDFQQNIAQWQRNLLAAQVKAAPDPNMVELAEGFDNFFETWKNVGMGAIGGWMGGLQGIGGTGANNSKTPSGATKTAAQMDGGMGGGGGSWLNFGGGGGGGGGGGSSSSIDWNAIIQEIIRNSGR